MRIMQKSWVCPAALPARSHLSNAATAVISACSHCAPPAIASAPKYWVCLHFTAVHPFRLISVSLVKVGRTCSYSLFLSWPCFPCIDPKALIALAWGEELLWRRWALAELSNCSQLNWSLMGYQVNHRSGDDNTVNRRGKNNVTELTKPAVRSLSFCSQKGVTLQLYVWWGREQAHPLQFSPWLEVPLVRFKRLHGAVRARGQSSWVFALRWTAGLCKDLATNG